MFSMALDFRKPCLPLSLRSLPAVFFYLFALFHFQCISERRVRVATVYANRYMVQEFCSTSARMQ